ncbi:MAG: glutamyl-tRNA reductase [Nitrospirae bacterium]|nr:glutamyl-tRNA reductase [Nitrospirota bacterium]
MNILAVGLNHKTADIGIRERVAFDGSKLDKAISLLKGIPEIKEHIVLSTCNRVEIYANVNNGSSGTELIKNFLVNFHGVSQETLNNALYIHSGENAIRHIFRVASSLDSMIVGEPQILGQLKDAFEFAVKRKTTGVILNRLMKKAISVAKRIRTETKIAQSAVSISFAAVELAKKIFEDLSKETFMLIGAGEMAELAAKHLIQNGVKNVIVTNRTYESAEKLAREFNGKAIEFNTFLHELVHADIVICSTGASHYILLKEQVQKTMKHRKNKPIFIIDISVPRNIDPEINDIDNIYLYDIDDLQEVIGTNIQERNKEAQKAERIVDVEVDAFLKWQESLSAVPTVVALREKAEAIKIEELEKAFRKLGVLQEKEIHIIEAMTNSIVNKLLHPPTITLKEGSEDREELIAVIRKLYGLNGDTENK